MFLSGASGLHLTKHENFHGGLDAISVGDGLFTILTTLSKKASSVQVMLQPILTYMACGYMGRQVSKLGGLYALRWCNCAVLMPPFSNICRAVSPPASCRSLFCGSSCECWTPAKLSRPSTTWVPQIGTILFKPPPFAG